MMPQKYITSSIQIITGYFFLYYRHGNKGYVPQTYLKIYEPPGATTNATSATPTSSLSAKPEILENVTEENMEADQASIVSSS